MEHLTIGFLGLGLIGGSLAKGIRKSFPQHIIYAYNHRRSSIEPALQDGVLDDIWDDIDSRFFSVHRLSRTPATSKSLRLLSTPM